MIAQEGLTFDEAKHQYFWQGVKVPGVNEILKAVGLTKDWTGIDPFYAQRGKAVHLAIEYYLKDELDETSLDPIVTPFFDGFRRYWDQHGTKPLAIESMRYNEVFSFAGTVDLETDAHIIDWKCSKSHDRVAELQGEAYKILVNEPKNFRVVQFPGDGSFTIFDYGNEVRYWPAALSLYRWKTKRK